MGPLNASSKEPRATMPGLGNSAPIDDAVRGDRAGVIPRRRVMRELVVL